MQYIHDSTSIYSEMNDPRVQSQANVYAESYKQIQIQIPIDLLNYLTTPRWALLKLHSKSVKLVRSITSHNHLLRLDYLISSEIWIILFQRKMQREKEFSSSKKRNRTITRLLRILHNVIL